MEQLVSSQEIEITITAQQAAFGVILQHTLPSGPARLRIPPCRDGDLVRARVGTEEVLLRIRVAGAAAAPTQPIPTTAAPNAFGAPAAPPGQASNSGARGCLVGLGVAAVLLIAFALLNNGDGDDAKTASGTRTPTYSSSYSSSPSDSYSPSYSSSPSYEASPDPTYPTYSAAPASPTAAAPSPFDRGTCLNGELPDSTTAQRVSGVEEVSCSASDAHYRVIESIPMTSDLNRCNDNPKTEYAFSYRYTLNGSVINQYVYCLVGIGSYAR